VRVINIVFFILVSGCIGLALATVIYSQRIHIIKYQVLFKKVSSKIFLSSHHAWFARIIVLVVFILSVAVLKHVDVSWEHYNKSGLIVIVYWVSRFILSVYLFVIFYTTGKLFLRLLVGSNRVDFKDGYEEFIISIFCGAFLHGLLFIVAGGLGILHFSLALAISVPILFYAPKVVGEGLSSFRSKMNDFLLQENRHSLIMSLLMCWFLFVICLSILFSKVIYPGSLGNDVWEHYLPYYRSVLNSGSTAPNELWYHFYLSKGAGLFFYGGLLSDCFAPQLVSWVILLVTALILFHILRRTVGNIQWALLGSILFLGLYDGDFVKHHTVVTGCIAFLFWSAIQLLESKTEINSKIILTGAILCSVYIGLYQPYQAALFFTMLAFFTLIISFFPSTSHSILKFSLILSAMFIGITIILMVNYTATGLILDVPIKFFWKYANHDKFLNLFGPSGVLYFLFMNDLSQIRYNFLSFFTAFRFINEFIFLFIYVFLFSILNWFVGHLKIDGIIYENKIKTLKILGYYSFLTIIFIFPAIIFCQSFQVASINRIYSFTIFFTSLIIIFLLRVLWLIFSSGILVPWINSMLTVTVTVFILVFTISGISQDRWNAISHYMCGEMSFCDVLVETDLKFHRSIKFQVWDKIRQHIGPEKYIFALSNNAAPGYSFPGAGAISEPSYALGVDYRQIIFGPPAQAKELLQKMKLNHFIVDLNSETFSGIAFSRLFNVFNINSYLRVILQEGDVFVLTWRQPNSSESIPLHVRQVLEFKQNPVFYYPYSKDFDYLIQTKVEAKFKSINIAGDKRLTSKTVVDSLSDLSDDIAIALRSNMEEKVFLFENQVLIKKLITEISNKLTKESQRTYMLNWQNFEKEQQTQDVFFNTIKEIIVKKIHHIVRVTFVDGYVSSWGEKTTIALFNDTSGNHFRQIYQDPQKVYEMLM